MSECILVQLQCRPVLMSACGSVRGVNLSDSPNKVWHFSQHLCIHLEVVEVIEVLHCSVHVLGMGTHRADKQVTRS